MDRWLLVLVAALAMSAPAAAGEEEMVGGRSEGRSEGSSEGSSGGRNAFVVMEHQGGSLAVSLGSIVSVFRAQVEGDAPAPVRLNFRSGGHQALAGDAAAALWASLAEGPHADDFLWVSHMGGTLGIPLAAVESAFRAGSEAVVVRINYAGDPEGKTVQGDEAEAVWQRLSR